jgi:hypothetical protein
MVLDNSYPITPGTPPDLGIEIIYMPGDMPGDIPYDEMTIFGCDDLYWGEYDSDINPNAAYDDYEEFLAILNTRTHFEDLRKQETRDYEKDRTHQCKRREKQLTRKSNKTNAKMDYQATHKKKSRPSKKSGRRSPLGQDIVLC